MSAWLDKRGLAEHLVCSVRSIEKAMVAGMPHAIIFGRAKFQPADAETWLERHGYLTRAGEVMLPDDEDQAARQRVNATGP